MVAGRALDAMADKWDGQYITPAALAVGHDDEYVRAKALRALLANMETSKVIVISLLLLTASLLLWGVGHLRRNQNASQAQRAKRSVLRNVMQARAHARRAGVASDF